MKLFLLVRVGETQYDEYVGFVVRAKDEFTARNIANTMPGDEGHIWSDPLQVRCTEITTKGDEGIVLGSFNAG